MIRTAPTKRLPEGSPAWKRFLFTPIGHILSGRSGMYRSYRQIVASASLPSEAAELTIHCVRRTRLWRAEKAAVAAELVAHFTDGLEAGVSIDELMASFGDERRAARLIRRAKKRNRPAIIRAFGRLVQGLCLLLLVYVAYGVFFFLGKPNPTVDYLGMINEDAAAAGEEDRAWPIYREALLELDKLPAFSRWSRQPMPGEEGWAEAASYLEGQQESLQVIREAAGRPVLGFVLTHQIAPADRALWPGDYDAPRDENLLDNALIGILIPYLAELRRAGKALALDIQEAARQSDGATVVADARAMLGIAGHAREHPIVINNLVGTAVAHLGTRTLGDILSAKPEALDDEHLVQLAHLLAADTDELFTVRVSGERMSFKDVVQRIYTNDEDGDGRMTSEGLRSLYLLGGPNGPFKDDRVLQSGAGGLIGLATAPGKCLAIASRRELLQEYDAIMDLSEAQTHRPLWEITTFPAEDRVDALTSSPMNRLRYSPLVMLVPHLQHARIGAEYAAMESDAVMVAMGLELYRRRHGDWPGNLERLVPDLLPSIPPDRFDGEPMRYALINGGPVLYSIGYDRDDDGGKPPISDRTGEPDYDAARRFSPVGHNVTGRVGPVNRDGDWILWPRHIEPIVDHGPQDGEGDESNS